MGVPGQWECRGAIVIHERERDIVSLSRSILHWQSAAAAAMSSQVASPELVHAIAHSLDLAGLAPEAAKALSTDAEFRLRELIQVRVVGVVACGGAVQPESRGRRANTPCPRLCPMQDAQKFARHARRCKLTCEDVNNALRMRNVEVRACACVRTRTHAHAPHAHAHARCCLPPRAAPVRLQQQGPGQVHAHARPPGRVLRARPGAVHRAGACAARMMRPLPRAAHRHATAALPMRAHMHAHHAHTHGTHTHAHHAHMRTAQHTRTRSWWTRRCRGPLWRCRSCRTGCSSTACSRPSQRTRRSRGTRPPPGAP